VDAVLLRKARDAIGFMPDDEGLALHEAGLRGASAGPLLEVGTYCGKSAIYLGAAAVPRRARKAPSSTPSTTTAARRRTRPDGSTTTSASSTRVPAASTPCRSSGAPSSTRGWKTS
jgi:hypothetical protein